MAKSKSEIIVPQSEIITPENQIIRPPMKICITSGDVINSGKTTLADNLVAPRLNNPGRVEIENVAQSASKKPEVRAHAVSDFQGILRDFSRFEESDAVFDIGGSASNEFFSEAKLRFKHVTDYFDRVIFVVQANVNKPHIPVEKLKEFLALGVENEKVTVIFNFANFDIGDPVVSEQYIRDKFPGIFSQSERIGFHVCDTPVYMSEAFYGPLLSDPYWNSHKLARHPDMFKAAGALMRKGNLTTEDEKKIEELLAYSEIQSMASVFDANLDVIWSKFMSYYGDK